MKKSGGGVNMQGKKVSQVDTAGPSASCESCGWPRRMAVHFQYVGVVRQDGVGVVPHARHVREPASQVDHDGL